jgi:hypothetical protein
LFPTYDDIPELPPLLGERSEAVLAERGCLQDEIATMHADGAI